MPYKWALICRNNCYKYALKKMGKNSNICDGVTIDYSHMVSLDDELFLAICLQDNHKHIGNIKLGPINLIHKYAEISLFIGDKNEWGKGLATEAIYTLTNYVFDILKLHKLTAGCYANNISSVKAFKKAGFFEDGIWKNQYLCNGEYVDRICLAQIKNEV